MARPIKKGLNYFPLDVDFFEDEKIKFLAVECEAAGICALIKIFCSIYRNGYYIDWSEDHATMFSWDMRGMVAKDKVSDIVTTCLKRGIFSKEMYEKHHILTSRGIQDRYRQALDGKRQICIIEKYWMLDMPPGDKVTVVSINGEKLNDCEEESCHSEVVFGGRTTVNGSEIPQSKANKRKTKKIEFIPPTLEEVEVYFSEHGYTVESAKKAFDYYNVGGWKDRDGNPVRNWKQKMLSVWFTDKNLKIEKRDGTVGQCINF